jgi:hypothetical protein
MSDPLIPPRYAKLAGGLALTLGTAASLAPQVPGLPLWAPFGLWCLASVAALLTGVALPEYKGDPILAVGVAAPAFLSAGAVLKAIAMAQPTGGSAQNVLLFVGLAADALGGKALPSPGKAALPP